MSVPAKRCCHSSWLDTWSLVEVMLVESALLSGRVKRRAVTSKHLYVQGVKLFCSFFCGNAAFVICLRPNCQLPGILVYLSGTNSQY